MKPGPWLAIIMALAALPALAQPYRFSCVGAEKLEDDVFSIAFPRGSAAVPEAARSPLAAAIEAALAEPGRNICILGPKSRICNRFCNLSILCLYCILCVFGRTSSIKWLCE